MTASYTLEPAVDLAEDFAEEGVFTSPTVVISIDTTTNGMVFIDYTSGVFVVDHPRPAPPLFRRVRDAFEGMSEAVDRLAHEMASFVDATMLEGLLDEPLLKGWRTRCSCCQTTLRQLAGTHSDNLCKHCRRKRWSSGRGSRGRRARRAGRRPTRNSGPR